MGGKTRWLVAETSLGVRGHLGLGRNRCQSDISGISNCFIIKARDRPAHHTGSGRRGICSQSPRQEVGWALQSKAFNQRKKEECI